MTEIVLTETAKIIVRAECYEPWWFDKGGREYKSIHSGEIELSKPKWVHTGTWHDKIEGAIKELAKIKVLNRVEQATLAEYLNAVQAEIKELLKGLADVEEFHFGGVTFKVIEHD